MRKHIFTLIASVVIICLIILIGTLVAYSATGVKAQSLVTATPARFALPTATQPAVEEFVTATYTPTPEQNRGTGVTLQASTDAGAVNVRAAPDPESEILGTISAGVSYPVTGRYFRWIQFQYERSPNGFGWVFDGIVELEGDESSIPELDPNAQPTDVPSPTSTGGENSAENSDLIGVSGEGVTSTEELSLGLEEANVLPTFTYPPNVAALAPTDGTINALETTPESDGVTLVSDGELAPILPILLLAGFGLLGLVVSAIRR